METKVISSIRGKPMLVINNFKFNFNKDIKSTKEKFWKCINRQCKVAAHTLGSTQNIVVTKLTGDHSHEADTARLNRQVIGSSCKRKALEDLAEKPAKILKQAIQEDFPTNLTTVDVEYIRHNIYNARRTILPPFPRNINEVHKVLRDISVVTNKSEDFLLVNSESDNIVIFSCETNLCTLSTISRIYLDGTFDYCTKYFLQLFTIHGYINGHYIPMLFCLLPNKTAITYKQLFRLIISACLRKNIVLHIREVVMDFEKAIHSAVSDVWPDIKVIGCRFHLTQSWFRKIQSYGLTTEYKTDSSEIGRWLKQTFSLTYLDPEEVGECFVLDLVPNMPQDSRVIAYADYLVDTYISEEATFPPSIWAEHSACLSRTTNSCESFHKHFNESLYTNHPNLFVFIEKLKDFQTDTYIKIQSLHIPAKIHNSKVKKKQQFMNSVLAQYKNKQISRLHLVKCLSFHCSL